jgi:hypothetical protein
LANLLLSGCCSVEIHGWSLHPAWLIPLGIFISWLLRAGYQLLLLEWFSRKSPTVRKDILEFFPKLTRRWPPRGSGKR